MMACLVSTVAGSLKIPPPMQLAVLPLMVLHNNDGASQLVDLGPGLKDFGGVARFFAAVQREGQDSSLVAGKSGVIMVSSGDNSLAGPEFTAGLRKGIFYDALALDPIGYDAIVLGNHDFYFGPEVLTNFIKQVIAKLPFSAQTCTFPTSLACRPCTMRAVLKKAWWCRKMESKSGLSEPLRPTFASYPDPATSISFAT